MGFCCVFGCSNRTNRNKRKPGVSFHRFPKQKPLKEKWIRAIRREKWEPGPHSLICSEHFSNECLNRTFASGKTEIREESIPTIFPAYPSHLQPQNKKVRKPPRLREMPVIPEPVLPTEEPMEITESEPSSKEIGIQVDETSKFMTEMTNARTHLEWKVKDLSRRLQEKSIIIKKMRRRNTRLNVRISSVKSLVKDLQSKHLVDGECALQLQNFPDLQRDLFLRNVKKIKKNYPPSIRAFALTLDFYSPKAYRYVRDTFDSCLPHPRSLARWYATIDAAPGFCLEALNALNEKGSDSNPLICALIVDEMAITNYLKLLVQIISR